MGRIWLDSNNRADRVQTDMLTTLAGLTPVSSVKWPFVLSSSSEVKLSSATLNLSPALLYVQARVCISWDTTGHKSCTFKATGKSNSSFFLFVTMFTLNYFYVHCMGPLKVADCFSRFKTSRLSFCAAVISHQLALGTVLSTVPVFSIPGDL